MAINLLSSVTDKTEQLMLLQAYDRLTAKGICHPKAKSWPCHHSVVQSLYLLWSVMGKTGQLVLIAVWHQIILQNDRWVHRLMSLDTHVQMR